MAGAGKKNWDEGCYNKNVFNNMWKWFKWILLAIGILLFLGAAVTLIVYKFFVYLNPDEIVKAEKALSLGVTIQDDKDDFVIMGTNKEKANDFDKDVNNPSPYRLPFLDVKSVSVGADEKYLYYKITFFEKIPSKPTHIIDDKLRDFGCKLGLMNRQGKEYAILVTNVGFAPFFSMMGSYYFTGPTGVVWPEEDRFTDQDSNSKVAGGGGKDYIIGAFPLNKLGQPKAGDNVYLSFSEEARSRKYSHAAVDNLLGEGKMPAFVSWKYGTSDYQILEQSWQDGY
jgi:hypothetical protein